MRIEKVQFADAKTFNKQGKQQLVPDDIGQKALDDSTE
tara:strand:- start:410 stop:523 length:114 start_codon:yes stop_codon:yes gene_type:complete